MKKFLLFMFLFMCFFSKSFSGINEYCLLKTEPVDSIRIDSLKTTNLHPVKIFYEFLGSSIWMSLNYQHTIFSRNRYSFDFLAGINNWEFSEFDIINSHFFLLNRISNKSKKLFIEFGPGFKLGGSLGERRQGYDFSWNTSIMKVFNSNLFIKFNTTLSLSYFLIKEKCNGYYFCYSYASFPIGLSFGYRFNDFRTIRNKNNNLKINLPKNIIAINSILGLSYDRLIFRNDFYSLYLSINPNFYVFKKFDVSEKYGFALFDRNFINYVQQINSIIYTEFGTGVTIYKEKYSIFEKMYSKNTNQINLNMGIRIMPQKHLIIKINYYPALWSSNYNLTYGYYFNIFDYIVNKRYTELLWRAFFISVGFAF